MCKKRCVDSCHVEVVWLDRYRGEDVLDECPPSLPALALGKLDADQQFRCGDRRDHHVVLIADYLVERFCQALGGYEDRRVEYQPVQTRSSMASAARSSVSSDAHRRSGGLERRISFTRLPLPALAGSIRATA